MKLRLALALSLIVVFASAGYLVAQERASRELLRELGRDFDRADLPADVTFAGDAGETIPGVRCATRMPGEFERWLIESGVEEARADRSFVARKATVVIPIVFHIMLRKNGKFDVSDEAIAEQVKVLNRSFRGSGYQFELQDIRRVKKNKFANGCMRQSVERTMKRKHAVDPVNTLNVYSCRPGRALGYAWLPSDWPEDSTRHGVVMLYSSFPGGASAPYNEGDTLTHEVGHYLGLYHTFHDPNQEGFGPSNGCREPGDYVDDTNPQREPHYGCPAPGSRNTCSGSGPDPLDNFMGYVDDPCMTRFTPGQIERIDGQLGTYKPGLLDGVS